MRELFLSVFDVPVSISCGDAEIAGWLHAGYGRLIRSEAASPVLRYRIERGEAHVVILRDGQSPICAQDSGELLFYFEKDLTIALQHLRRDLYFVHAAALAVGDRIAVIAGPPGAGKSTLCWALLHEGLGYLSDELAPVDPETLVVRAYPRAPCLKREPPAPYALPADTLRTSYTLHVPVEALPCPVGGEHRLAAIFFVRYVAGAPRPTLTPITPGRASARLYANTLNHLAHPDAGLPTAARIAGAVPCFEIETAGLKESCGLVKSVFAGM